MRPIGDACVSSHERSRTCGREVWPGASIYIVQRPLRCKRMTKYRVAGSAGGMSLEGGKSNQRRQEAQAAGVSSPTRRMETLTKPGNTEPRYSRTGSFIRRQLSMTDRMAATFGPACESGH